MIFGVPHKGNKYWPMSCERDSFAKGGKSLSQRRKTTLLGWRVNETYLSKGRKFPLA
jgi:hypothetical protein